MRDVPVIGLGTWQTFDVGAADSEREPLEEVLRPSWTLGGRWSTRRRCMARAEEVLGDLVTSSDLRDEAVPGDEGLDAREQPKASAQMQASLRKLRTERHRPDAGAQPGRRRGAPRYAARVEAGRRVRYIGVTHYTASAHEEVARVIAARPVDFVQINYSVAERDASGACSRSRGSSASP